MSGGRGRSSPEDEESNPCRKLKMRAHRSLFRTRRVDALRPNSTRVVRTGYEEPRMRCEWEWPGNVFPFRADPFHFWRRAAILQWTSEQREEMPSPTNLLLSSPEKPLGWPFWLMLFSSLSHSPSPANGTAESLSLVAFEERRGKDRGRKGVIAFA